MMKAPILSMIIIVLAAICLSVVSAGKGGSSSSSSRSGMSSSMMSGKKYKKYKKKKSHSSSSKMKSSKVKLHRSRYYHAMSYAGKGQGGGDDEYYGTGRHRGSSGGGGGGHGKGKGVFSHDNDQNNDVDQDEVEAPTPAPIAYVVPPTFVEHHTPAPIPTLFLPTVNGSVQGPSAPSPPTPSASSVPVPSAPSAPTPSASSVPSPSVPTAPTPSSPSQTVNGSLPTNSPNGSGTGDAPSPTSTGNVDQEEYEPQPRCETTNGIFGSLEGESVAVYFGYELETSPISDEKLMDEILPPLEVQFNDLILPTLFPKTCSVTVLTRRRLTVEGISARPDDEPISTDKVSCLLLTSPDNQCRFVRGKLTIFVENYQESDSIRVRKALEDAMKNNSFDEVNPIIKRVAYVGVPDEDSDQSPANPPVDEDDKDLDVNANSTNSNGLLVGLVVAGASGICIAAAAVTYSRIARKDAAPDSIIGGSNADIPASQITPYDSVSIDTSASDSTAEYQFPANTESILVDPEQDVASVDELLEPPEEFVSHDEEDLLLLASTDHQQPQQANEHVVT